MAVLGEFEAAHSVANDPILDDFRKGGVVFVILLELFRHGRVVEAIALFDKLSAKTFGVTGRVDVVLGLAGRIPGEVIHTRIGKHMVSPKMP